MLSAALAACTTPSGGGGGGGGGGGPDGGGGDGSPQVKVDEGAQKTFEQAVALYQKGQEAGRVDYGRVEAMLKQALDKQQDFAARGSTSGSSTTSRASSTRRWTATPRPTTRTRPSRRPWSTRA